MLGKWWHQVWWTIFLNLKNRKLGIPWITCWHFGQPRFPRFAYEIYRFHGWNILENPHPWELRRWGPNDLNDHNPTNQKNLGGNAEYQIFGQLFWNVERTRSFQSLWVGCLRYPRSVVIWWDRCIWEGLAIYQGTMGCTPDSVFHGRGTLVGVHPTIPWIYFDPFFSPSPSTKN